MTMGAQNGDLRWGFIEDGVGVGIVSDDVTVLIKPLIDGVGKTVRG